MFDELNPSDQKDENENATEENPVADLLKGIVTEDGRQKYASIEDALKALAHAQKFIPELQGENSLYKQELEELKKKIEAVSNVDEVVERLLEKRNQTEKKEEPKVENQTETPNIEEAFEQFLAKREAANSFKANVESVTGELRKRFGDKAAEATAARLSELGMDNSSIEQLAGKNPRAALELLLPNSTKTSAPATGTSVNTAKFIDKPEEKPIEKPSKSMLAGASSKEQTDYLRSVKESVFKRLGVETN